jgi:hypothetical protein
MKVKCEFGQRAVGILSEAADNFLKDGRGTSNAESSSRLLFTSAVRLSDV